MKILITNTTLCNFYGSQIFTYSLALELQRQGHEICCYSPKLGQIAELIRQAKIAVTDDPSSIPNDIDVIHTHHRHESLVAFASSLDKPMVMVCHGVLPWQEQPLKARMNITHYVGVSEEIRDHLVATHQIAAENVRIIRNGIDLSRFYCRTPINNDPKKLLVLSNHTAPEQLQVITEACARRSIELVKIGFPAENIWNVEDYINDADVVVSLGRGVLEATACKRVVIVYDYNGADGLLTQENFPVFRLRNFSGRTNKLQLSTEEFLKVLDNYDPGIPDKVYGFIPEHDLSVIAGQYLDLYQASIKSFHKPQTASLAHNLAAGIIELKQDLNKEIGTRESQLRQAKLNFEQLSSQQKQQVEEMAARLLKSQEEIQQRWGDIAYRDGRIRQISEERTALESRVEKQAIVLSENGRVLAEKDAQINGLSAELANLDARLTQLVEELACAGALQFELEKWLDHKSKEIVSRDDSLKQIRQEIVLVGEHRVELETLIERKNAELADLDVRIAQLVEELATAAELRAELEKWLEHSSTEVVTRDELIQQLKTEIVLVGEQRRDLESKLHGKTAALLDRDERIRQIEEEIARQARQVDEYLARLGDERDAERQGQDRRISDMENQLREKEQRIADLLNSKSWQITAPLRKVLDLIGGGK